MEVLPLTTFELLLIGLIVIGSAKFISMVYRQCSYWKNSKVPYVWAFPVFGTAWRLLFQRISFRDYCTFIYNYYSDVRYVGVMDFATPTVVIKDPELIREIGVKSFEHFPNHRSFVTEEMDPIFGKNLFSLKDERWKIMRNILSPSFTTSKIKFMFNLVSNCSRDFVNYLHDHPDCCSMVEAKNIFTRYTNDVIATVALGISVNSMKDPDNELYKKGLDVSRFSGVFRLIKFMLFRLNPHLTRMVGFTFLSQATSKFFWDLITETVRTRRKQRIIRPDMIHLLMQAKNSDEITSSEMSIDYIVAQAFIFFLAGFDTVSTVLSHTIYELALHQDIQERLREEVDRYLIEGNGEISYESLSKMEYMEMVISESLRMHPATMLTDRLCTQQFQLPPAGPGYNSVTVHPGENIWFPIYTLHHDPKYFSDPEKFDPERFNKENMHKIDPYAYIPFGVGPRKCIGNRFALMEVKVLLVHLIQKFVIKPNERTSVPLVYKKGSFTLAPQDGFWFTLEKRNSLTVD
ncbi:cytochrome P450 9e2 [Xylocopa sonorina]|uniref:cytochrome P450 9e2 n=1 Tax=Xylocopa sonorina TaxID=1818115 RepID=UPI00403AD2DA